MRKRKLKTYILLGHEESECVVTSETLEKAIEYIQTHQRLKNEFTKKGSCSRGRTLRSLRLIRGQLRTRQLPDIGHCLRIALLKHQWNDAVHLAQFLNCGGISRYSSVIIRTCFYLLINHPNSSRELLENFIRKCTGYDLPEDIRKFIKMLFAIRKEPMVQSQKHSCVKFQIVNDLVFSDL